MTRPPFIPDPDPDPATLAATGRALEEGRRRAIAAGFKVPAARQSPLCAAAVAPSDRPGRVRQACALWGAPADLAAEFNTRAFTVRQVHALLGNAIGSAKWISAAGIQQVRIALVALDHARAAETNDRSSSTTKHVGALLVQHDLTHTRVGVAIASSTLPVDVLGQLVKARANLFGRLDPHAQAGLLRDLSLTAATLNTSKR